MARIYGLYTEQMCWYVGSTVIKLKYREYMHRHISNKAYSKYISNEFEWKMCLIEECAVEDKLIREQYYIELLKPLYNERNSIYQENKEEIAEYSKQYRQKNKEKIAQRKKQYSQDNKEKIAEYDKQKYQKNKKKIAERMKQYYQKKKLENSKISERISVE